ncbi:MAG: hypothetical protein IJW66_02840 [Clostridia bacterium]|nr:hypothetical protein [Clostridia bacterium]
MTEIIEFLIGIAIALLIIRLCVTVYKRIFLIFKMREVAALDGVTVECKKTSLLSLFTLSRTPEYVVRLPAVTYLVRTYNGGGADSVVHFASEKFTVRFSRMKSTTHRAARGFFTFKGGFAMGSRVKILPRLEYDADEFRGSEIREALIFNPAPNEVSYVIEQKTSIRVAFTGDEVYGREIFTATTFFNHIDREIRQALTEKIILQ